MIVSEFGQTDNMQKGGKGRAGNKSVGSVGKEEGRRDGRDLRKDEGKGCREEKRG